MNGAKALSLKDLVTFLIKTLGLWARRKSWGEIKITVQAGQIVFVTEQISHRDRLPVDAGTTEADVVRQLAAVV